MARDSVPGLTERLVGFLQRYPKLSLATGGVLFVFLAAGLTRVEMNFTYRSFFHGTDPLIRTFEAFEARFGSDDSIIVAVYSPSGIFDEDSVELVSELTERMWLVPDVIRVDSITNYPWVHAEGGDIFVEPFLPDDGPRSPAILEERKRLALSDETRELRRSDHELHIAGAPAMVTSFEEVSASDSARVIPLALLACTIILVVQLRNLAAVAMSLMVVVVAAVSAVGLTGWLGIEINAITGALPQILITIAVADSVHVLATFTRACRWAETPHQAARYALVKNFVPTIITSVTTTAGFLSFAASPIKPIAGLGLVAGLATAVTWLFTYLMVGGLLFLVPFRIRPVTARADINGGRRRFGELLARHRTAVLLGWSALSLAAVVISTQNRVDADPIRYFAEGHPLRVAFELVSTSVGSSTGFEVVVDSGRPDGAKDPDFLSKVDGFERWIEELPEVTTAVSLLDNLKQTHRALHGGRPEYYVLSNDKNTIGQELLLYTMSLPHAMDVNHRITMNHDALRITVLWAIGSSTEALAAIDRIESKGRSLGLAVTTTGKYQLFQRLEGHVLDSFLSSVTIALILVSGILMLCVRSIRLGMLALLANVVPLVIGGAILWLIGGTLNIGTVLVISVCLGIAVDDTVHVLSDYQRLVRKGCSGVAAINKVFAHTVPTLLATSAVLATTFGAFVLSTFTPYQVFGVMTACIVFVALLADVSFLPALLLGNAAPAPDRAVRSLPRLPRSSMGSSGEAREQC